MLYYAVLRCPMGWPELAEIVGRRFNHRLRLDDIHYLVRITPFSEGYSVTPPIYHPTKIIGVSTRLTFYSRCATFSHLATDDSSGSREPALFSVNQYHDTQAATAPLTAWKKWCSILIKSALLDSDTFYYQLMFTNRSRDKVAASPFAKYRRLWMALIEPAFG